MNNNLNNTMSSALYTYTYSSHPEYQNPIEDLLISESEYELSLAKGPELLKKHEADQTITGTGTKYALVLRNTESRVCTWYSTSLDQGKSPPYKRVTRNAEFPNVFFQLQDSPRVGVIQGGDLDIFHRCFEEAPRGASALFVLGVLERCANEGLIEQLPRGLFEALKEAEETDYAEAGEGALDSLRWPDDCDFDCHL